MRAVQSKQCRHNMACCVYTKVSKISNTAVYWNFNSLIQQLNCIGLYFYVAHWRLCPLFRLLYLPQTKLFVFLSKTAKTINKAIINSIRDRSIWTATYARISCVIYSVLLYTRFRLSFSSSSMQSMSLVTCPTSRSSHVMDDDGSDILRPKNVTSTFRRTG